MFLFTLRCNSGHFHIVKIVKSPILFASLEQLILHKHVLVSDKVLFVIWLLIGDMSEVVLLATMCLRVVTVN